MPGAQGVAGASPPAQELPGWHKTQPLPSKAEPAPHWAGQGRAEQHVEAPGEEYWATGQALQAAAVVAEGVLELVFGGQGWHCCAPRVSA